MKKFFSRKSKKTQDVADNSIESEPHIAHSDISDIMWYIEEKLLDSVGTRELCYTILYKNSVKLPIIKDKECRTLWESNDGKCAIMYQMLGDYKHFIFRVKRETENHQYYSAEL